MSLHKVSNQIICDFKVPSKLFFVWKYILCSNLAKAISLKYILASRIMFLKNLQNFKIVVSTSADVAFILKSILIDLSLLNRLLTSVNSSLQWF